MCLDIMHAPTIFPRNKARGLVMGKRSKKRATSFDRHIGKRLRAKRSELGVSQTTLADAVGIAFQQVQKYENGTNRISAGRLWEVAKFLKVPIQEFFDGLR